MSPNACTHGDCRPACTLAVRQAAMHAQEESATWGLDGSVSHACPRPLLQKRRGQEVTPTAKAVQISLLRSRCRGRLPLLRPSLLTLPTGTFRSRVAEGTGSQGRRFLREQLYRPAPRWEGGLHRQFVLLRLLWGPTRGSVAGGEPAGLGAAPPFPGSDPERRGGPARVDLRPGHPLASQSTSGGYSARFPVCDPHVLRSPPPRSLE